ncbi:hypothetical protein [Bacillus sp. MMSF_3328]|uniref:hypothetical protein n=1 Tax=Bacillus sp. MMSF_3328 TaxID=3047080 RepID=UPI00273EBE57|nr:hypothetical protein [Bacillus sp. MMSF_3328]
MFDHIGFFVSEKEQLKICENANKLNWKVDKGERRTFIATPYNFRIELQSNENAVDSLNDQVKIQQLKLAIKKAGIESDLLLCLVIPHIILAQKLKMWLQLNMR